MATNIGALASMDPESAKAVRDLARALALVERDVVKALKTRVYSEVEVPLARSAAAQVSARGKYPITASSVRAARGGRGGALASIWIGRGNGLGALLAVGSEFGGQKNRKVRYITLSRTRSSRYIVSRRTTMQFWPHLGTTGYVVAPYLRSQASDTARKTIGIVMDVLKALPGAREVRV